MTKSTGGIHLVGAAALIAQAEQRGRGEGMTRDNIRVQTALIMVKQFRDQIRESGTPDNDPARNVCELMLDSFEGVLTK